MKLQMNGSIFHRAVVSFAMVMACSYSSIAFCLTPDEIKQLRKETEEATSNSQLGAIYGHIISFVSVPDISASNLEIDAGVNTETLDIFKIPLHYRLETNSVPYYQSKVGVVEASGTGHDLL
jgi:hypothetical protein